MSYEHCEIHDEHERAFGAPKTVYARPRRSTGP